MQVDELKPGDVVELKSGGPDMTVSWVENQDGVLEARCDWFDKSQKQESAVFPTSSLRKIK
ncbi:MAG: DUF2158 domain-containing protein [Thalassospira sp.]|uniref:YodC family protein n=1 Tax=Thalassospira sp. GB04J01 TaxID=1485225 RepID=UPI000C10D31A|nr:DUF2158 domain-containing protein [Thalassospira sp. GB04J01]MBV15957.1 DUF2158 domain-containing protein [Thalassospira sp.]|tara:strand:- start:145074 stop:145256 length:183 start_codon:yes stop_codon:yes gene_type:complete